MQIDIPKAFETLVLQQAQDAGYASAEDYVVSLILSHQPEAERDSARLERLAKEGLNSGRPSPLDLEPIREEIRNRVGSRKQ